jgi:hypothetical protein
MQFLGHDSLTSISDIVADHDICEYWKQNHGISFRNAQVALYQVNTCTA